VITVVGRVVTATVVFVGVAVVCVVATVVCVGGLVVTVVAMVVSVGGLVVRVVATVVCVGGIVVRVVATVVCDVVTLSALTGSTKRSIARNTATGMTDDPIPCDIDKFLPDGFTGDFL
jgi:hypothetical protein